MVLNPLSWNRDKLNTTLEKVVSPAATFREDTTENLFILDIYDQGINGSLDNKILFRLKIKPVTADKKIHLEIEELKYKGEVLPYDPTDEASQALTLDSMGASISTKNTSTIYLEEFWIYSGIGKSDS